MNNEEFTCELCKYEHEDINGIHCRNCKHNVIVEENFYPKDKSEQQIKIETIQDCIKVLNENINNVQNEKYTIGIEYSINLLNDILY